MKTNSANSISFIRLNSLFIVLCICNLMSTSILKINSTIKQDSSKDITFNDNNVKNKRKLGTSNQLQQSSIEKAIKQQRKRGLLSNTTTFILTNPERQAIIIKNNETSVDKPDRNLLRKEYRICLENFWNVKLKTINEKLGFDFFYDLFLKEGIKMTKGKNISLTAEYYDQNFKKIVRRMSKKYFRNNLMKDSINRCLSKLGMKQTKIKSSKTLTKSFNSHDDLEVFDPNKKEMLETDQSYGYTGESYQHSDSESFSELNLPNQGNQCPSPEPMEVEKLERKLIGSIRINNNFARQIGINDVSVILNAIIPFGGGAYTFNHDDNKIFQFNVGQGNGAIVQTILQDRFQLDLSTQSKDYLNGDVKFDLPNGTPVNWIIDAGSKGNPRIISGSSINKSGAKKIHVAKAMAMRFCPDGFKLGIVFISHLDEDHYNLVMAILLRCVIKYFQDSDAAGDKMTIIKNVLTQIANSDTTLSTTKQTEILGTLGNITKWGPDTAPLRKHGHNTPFEIFFH